MEKSQEQARTQAGGSSGSGIPEEERSAASQEKRDEEMRISDEVFQRTGTEMMRRE